MRRNKIVQVLLDANCLKYAYKRKPVEQKYLNEVLLPPTTVSDAEEIIFDW